ncbi:hypothetical protein ACWATR_38395 [Nostoc sp. UIC 10890]
MSVIKHLSTATGIVFLIIGAYITPAQAANFTIDFNFLVKGGRLNGFNLDGLQGIGQLKYIDSGEDFEFAKDLSPALISNPSFVSSSFLKFINPGFDPIIYPSSEGTFSNVSVAVTTDGRISSLQVTGNNLAFIYNFLDKGKLNGVPAGDLASISGTYTVTKDSSSASVPEPSFVLGLLGSILLALKLKK